MAKSSVSSQESFLFLIRKISTLFPVYSKLSIPIITYTVWEECMFENLCINYNIWHDKLKAS